MDTAHSGPARRSRLSDRRPRDPDGPAGRPAGPFLWLPRTRTAARWS